MSFLGNAGPWRDRIYLVGGLAPRYIVGKLPEGVPAHIGTTDVDFSSSSSSMTRALKPTGRWRRT